MKANTLETVKEFLEKARRRLSDENPDYADMDDENNLESEDEDSNMEEKDDADRWLEEQKKIAGGGDAVPDPVESEPNEAVDDVPDATEDVEEVSEEPRRIAKPPVKKQKVEAVSQPPSSAVASNDDLQPTREELAALREYTRPWEQNARDHAKLVAEAHVNPGRHHQGRLIEARNLSHADRQKAYEAMTQSPEFQSADPITQMEMEGKFHEDWHKQNPEHLINALGAHHEAHKKGNQAMQTYQQVKDEKIRHIASGGVQPGAMSLEEGMQHAGGSREDEDSGPSGIQQDKSAQFAAGNQEFVNQYMKDYDKKAKRYSSVADLDNLDSEGRADINSVLGDPPAFKDPAKKRQHDKFVERYYPLFGKAARQVIAKLGLTQKANSGQIDYGLLHEAGTHALYQAINDYDPDHPSKAKFTTHLSNKMRGLMQSALKAQDEIPATMRAGAKKFDQQKRAESAAPVKHTNKEGVTAVIPPSTPKRSAAEIASAHHPDIQDRLKRVAAAKAPLVRRQATVQPSSAAQKPAGPKMTNVRNVVMDEEE